MIDFSATVLAAAMGAFAQPITVTPIASQPNNPAPYLAQGVYALKAVTIEQEGGFHQSFQPTLGIRLADFAVAPVQGDAITMAEGSFVVFNVIPDGQGGADLQLRATS